MSNIQSAEPKVHRNRPIPQEMQESLGKQVQQKKEEFENKAVAAAAAAEKAKAEAAKLSPTPGTPERYFIILDEKGKPSNSVTTEQPDADTPYITVQPTPAVNTDMVMTSSGAPITEQMNPEHSFRDAGMEARNPIPARPGEAPKKAASGPAPAQKK